MNIDQVEVFLLTLAFLLYGHLSQTITIYTNIALSILPEPNTTIVFTVEPLNFCFSLKFGKQTDNRITIIVIITIIIANTCLASNSILYMLNKVKEDLILLSTSSVNLVTIVRAIVQTMGRTPDLFYKKSLILTDLRTALLNPWLNLKWIAETFLFFSIWPPLFSFSFSWVIIDLSLVFLELYIGHK